jgi:hypothetical protein
MWRNDCRITRRNSLCRTLPDSDSITIERRGSAGDNDSPSQHGREAETSSAGNDAARPLSAHERLGDDAANWRDTILGGDRGAH